MSLPKDPKKREEYIESLRVAQRKRYEDPEEREKIRRTLIKRNKEHPPLPNASWFKVGCAPWNRGLTKETDSRVAKNSEGRSENQKHLWQDPGYREGQLKTLAGKFVRKRILIETRRCECGGCDEIFECKVNSKQRFIHGHNTRGSKHSDFMKQLWQDPEFVSKQMVARNVCPNKAEIFLEGFFQDLLPDEYRFVGDGKDKDFIIAGKVPDFVNVSGQKKIIELFGEHVHEPEEEQQRIDLFAQHGYQTLIIWYSELKDIESLKRKLVEFNIGEWDECIRGSSFA